MPKTLSTKAVRHFERDGFYFPLRVMTRAEARTLRGHLERYEAEVGGPIHSNMRHKVHLLFTWANALVRHPVILDAVEDLIGPNILCWTTNFFIKEANDPAFVSWHQDSTYWGLDPPEVASAWVAFTDAPVESGAMKFIPGSHKWPQIPHRDTFDKDNLLSRGQEIEMAVNESEAVAVPLEAGEISLHHIRLAHGSEPNRTADRRIGLAIRYIPPHVRQVKGRDSSMLVRGADTHGHHDPEPDPKADLDRAALAAHKRAIEQQVAALYSGTEVRAFRR
ncbi:MAG: phytanoyl-CoA dioxygenase family protein [Alphaproteobacteria bacterium]